MKFTKIILASLLVTVSNPIFASSEWTSNQGNGGHTGFIDIDTNPGNYHQIWERKLGYTGTIASTITNMIVIKNIAFYDVDEHSADKKEHYHRLIALSTNNGKTRWQKQLGKNSDCRGLNYIYGKLLLTTNKDNHTWVRAYHPRTGQYASSLQFPGLANSTESDDLNLYIMFQVAHPGSEAPMLASIDTTTGQTNWMVQESIRGVHGFAVSSNYLMTQYYDGSNYHELETGKLAFGTAFGNQWLATNIKRYPVIDDKTHSAYLIYMKQFGDHRPEDVTLFAHDLTMRAYPRWELPLQSALTNPVVAGNEVYSTQYDFSKLNAVNAVTGKIMWTWSPQDDLIDPEIPQLATRDVIFVAGKKRTYAVSRATHQTMWQIDKVGRLAIGDDKLFIISMQNGSMDHVSAFGLS